MTITERIPFVISELNFTEQGQHTKFCIFKNFESFIMSLAILLLSLPHFVLEDYVVSDYHTLSNETKSSIASTRRSTNQSLWVIYLVIMIFISSAGSMPLYTTGTLDSCESKVKFNSAYTIVEKETDEKRGARNIGLINVCGNIVGSLSGLGLGGLANALWVHPLKE